MSPGGGTGESHALAADIYTRPCTASPASAVDAAVDEGYAATVNNVTPADAAALPLLLMKLLIIM